jgi:hypothetical protein
MGSSFAIGSDSFLSSSINPMYVFAFLAIHSFLHYISLVPTQEHHLSSFQTILLRHIIIKSLEPWSTSPAYFCAENKLTIMIWPLATPLKAATCSPAQPRSLASLLTSTTISPLFPVNMPITLQPARIVLAASDLVPGPSRRL